MSNGNPLISVIIPVFNRAKYLGESIESILNQTLSDFELIIVDDASNDNPDIVARKYCDRRIRFFRNSENLGVAASRNLGIRKAKGEFIAFLDSDDISYPIRFEEQIKIFKYYPDVNICGSWIKFLDNNQIIQYREWHHEILTELLRRCSLSLVSVMIRKKCLSVFLFKEEMRYGEDYDLWSRMIWKCKAYNLQQPLVHYRRHKNQLSAVHRVDQILVDAEIQLSLFKRLEYSFEKFPDCLVKKNLIFSVDISVKEFALFLEWLKLIQGLNNRKEVFFKSEFNRVVELLRWRLIEKIYKTADYKLSKKWKTKALIYLTGKELMHLMKYKGRQYLKNHK